MKVIENDQIFTEVSSEEAVTINGGINDPIRRYIAGITAASGAYRFLPLVRPIIAGGLIGAWQRGGTRGQLDYLLSVANRLTRF